MRRSAVFAALLLFTQVLGTPAQNLRTLHPVDEAAQNPDFLAFKMRLQDIIAKRDTAALLEVVHPDIKIGFGGDHGAAAFQEEWKPREPGSTVWKELAEVLRLGGTFDGPTLFTTPYTFSRWPNGIDAFEFSAVTGSSVRIRNAPSLNAPVVTTVSYAILELVFEDKPVEGWTAVKLDGKTAYLDSRYIRSPIDYRARFEYSEGRWRMVMFLAGD
ncbi:MAG TPA: SH3 domain-containing protein [Terriglobia bacterium]|nr:SH3 domain-containing protein [Terriglobia bacterium]